MRPNLAAVRQNLARRGKSRRALREALAAAARWPEIDVDSAG
jgi:hypothetical protein